MLRISRRVNGAKGHISSLLALHFVILMKKIGKHLGGVWPHLKCKAPWEWEGKGGLSRSTGQFQLRKPPDIFGVRLKRGSMKDCQYSFLTGNWAATSWPNGHWVTKMLYLAWVIPHSWLWWHNKRTKVEAKNVIHAVISYAKLYVIILWKPQLLSAQHSVTCHKSFQDGRYSVTLCIWEDSAGLLLSNLLRRKELKPRLGI